MKYITATILLILWMIGTICLVISFLGIVVLIDEGNQWMNFPKKLLAVFEDKK